MPSWWAIKLFAFVDCKRWMSNDLNEDLCTEEDIINMYNVPAINRVGNYAGVRCCRDVLFFFLFYVLRFLEVFFTINFSQRSIYYSVAAIFEDVLEQNLRMGCMNLHGIMCCSLQ